MSTGGTPRHPGRLVVREGAGGGAGWIRKTFASGSVERDAQLAATRKNGRGRLKAGSPASGSRVVNRSALGSWLRRTFGSGSLGTYGPEPDEHT